MGFQKSQDFLLTVHVPPGVKTCLETHFFMVAKYDAPEGGVVLVLEGNYRAMKYYASIAKFRDKLTNICLTYQGEFAKNPKEQNKWILG